MLLLPQVVALQLDREPAGEDRAQVLELAPGRVEAAVGEALGDHPLAAAGQAVEALGVGFHLPPGGARRALAGHSGLRFILGGAGTGKSSVCAALAARHGLEILDMDARLYGSWHGRFDPARHPANHAWSSAADPLAWQVALQPGAFLAFHEAATAEALDLLADELRGADPARPLVVDGGFGSVAVVARAVPASSIVCLALPPDLAATVWTGYLPDRTRRFSCRGTPLFHYMGCSTFAEYTVVPAIALAKINPAAPLDKVCLLGCGVTTGIGAVLNTARVEPGATVAVFGLGGIGLSVIQGAVMARAARIIAIDVNPDKFALATALGATDTLNPTELGASVVEAIQAMTRGGVDYSFECIGNVEVMRQALECCHLGWGVSTIIGVAGAGQEIRTRPFQLVTGRTWKGTAFGGVKGRSQLPGYVENYLRGTIELDRLVTHTLPLAQINTAFELMHAGKSIRSVILF